MSAVVETPSDVFYKGPPMKTESKMTTEEKIELAKYKQFQEEGKIYNTQLAVQNA